jgi:molybdopterin/thiamine biosynthesis adenylyltransferase
VALTKDELERYSRQLSMPGWGTDGQERLARARLFIAGVGGLGCAAGAYLATAGVGHITVCDADHVERSNLNRQFLYTRGDVGRDKAPIAAERLAAMNPSVKVQAIVAEIDRATAAGLIGGHDLVVDGLDNLETRFALNRACIAERIPMVYAAVADFTGYLSFLKPPETPCLECFIGRTPPPVEPAIPGCTPGILGALQAMEAIKSLTGAGDVLAGRLLIMEGAEPRFDVIEIERDPRCPACRHLGR